MSFLPLKYDAAMLKKD